VDTGSEISLVNGRTARYARALGIRVIPEEAQIQLADGTTANTPGSITLPINLHGRQWQHTFRVMPTLDSAVLVGIDLWARLQITLPPPPPDTAATGYSCSTTSGLRPHTPQEDRQLKTFLSRELALFDSIRGPTPKTAHTIRVKPGTLPIKQRYRPRNPIMQKVIDDEIRAMEAEGVIEPSTSAWSSPVVIVRKKDGKPRFCIDFRKVNSVTERDAYPLPHIVATLDKLRGAKYLSTIDLKQGYWQVPLAPESRPLTAFTVPGRGLMQFTVMPFGLHSAPATFQRLLDTILGPELEPHTFVYLDDIIVISSTMDDHLRHLEEVFRRLREAKLRVNPDKCHFGLTELKYLGHIVDRRGLRTDPEKVKAVTQWPTPTTVRQIRQFIGLASWYRRFIRDFSATAAPLTKLTRKNCKWSWGPEEDAAFKHLKRALTTAPILACPDFERKFVLQTDASTSGLGAVLSQHFEEGERVIAYASRTLNGAERNYSATELECLAVIWGIRHMRGYLEGYEFTVVTDHQALRWLQRLDSPSGRLGRWALELQQYRFDIRYRRGHLNRVADALSRRPEILAIKNARCPWYQRQIRRITARPEEYPDYELREGKLYRHVLHSTDFTEIPSEEQWKECVPRDRRPAILHRLHDDPTSGHLGTAKTIARAARSYYWPGMFADVTKYVQKCPNCLAYKTDQRRPAGLLHATAVTAPWEQVTTDLVGPLPRSITGHSWLLVIQDRFTKWVELCPMRSATAPAICKQLKERVFYRHGCPREITSDNGRQFIAKQTRQLLRTLGIRHRTTPAYTPQCNPVERTNKTVKTMIAQYVGPDHRHWDQRVPLLQFAYNTARHEATGYTPAYLNCGRELNSPHPNERRYPATTAEPEDIHRLLEDAYEVVRTNEARAFQRQARHYNLRRRPWKPEIGAKVWKRLHPLSSKSDAFNAKLAPKYIGPLEVRRIPSPVIVDLRDEKGRWHRHVHVRDLKVTAPDPNNNESHPEDDEVAL